MWGKFCTIVQSVYNYFLFYKTRAFFVEYNKNNKTDIEIIFLENLYF